ncbi:class I SAM-dependent methyltransferase [Microcella humidisoli]|uniref:Methyltransferase domain-containing protein n=1 Tax=Microcella humidisoli TaxID=2963406 RepID=A0ABY5FSY0_9MICO|nr:methyltransferase domain-containing protein [Microcella humidisoli]UTT61396.1 methyltransferase domain-containing protein [Microcella humidisoli]
MAECEQSPPAATYTHGHHASVLAAHRWRTIANSAAYLEPRLGAGRSLLDVGCGPGTITAELAGRLAPGRVVGLDAATDAIDAARRHAAEVGAAAQFAVGDAMALPFPDASFDIVHTHQTLQHVGDPVGMLREMARVAGPQGIVAAREVDYSATTWFPLLPGLDLWLDLYRRVHRGNGGEPDAGRHLKAWAVAAGLEASALTASVWLFSEPEDRAWWGGAWAERVLHSAFARSAIDGGHATPDELTAISEAWVQWSRHDDAMLTMTHVELVAPGLDGTRGEVPER